MGHAFSSQSFVTTAEHAELRERVAVLEEALKRPRDDEREADREQRQRTGPPTEAPAANDGSPRGAAVQWMRQFAATHGMTGDGAAVDDRRRKTASAAASAAAAATAQAAGPAPRAAAAAASSSSSSATAAAEPPPPAAADWRRWQANLQALKASRGTPVELSDSDDEPPPAAATAEPPPPRRRPAAARADGDILWVDRDGHRVALRADVVQEAQELMRSLGDDSPLF